MEPLEDEHDAHDRAVRSERAVFSHEFNTESRLRTHQILRGQMSNTAGGLEESHRQPGERRSQHLYRKQNEVSQRSTLFPILSAASRGEWSEINLSFQPSFFSVASEPSSISS